MNPNNIFIVGANGQLGRALRHQYPEAKFADIDEMDITDRQSVESFDWSGISIVLNGIDWCNFRTFVCKSSKHKCIYKDS